MWAGHVRDPSGRRHRLPDGCTLRPHQSAPDRPLAGRRAFPSLGPAGTIQCRGNVWVVQNPLPCLPCEKLGCDGHLDSHSQCLDELSVRQVLVAVDQALGRWCEVRRSEPSLARFHFGTC